jgi:hypothetical protein
MQSATTVCIQDAAVAENAFLLDEADGLLRRKLLSSLTGDV